MYWESTSCFMLEYEKIVKQIFDTRVFSWKLSTRISMTFCNYEINTDYLRQPSNSTILRNITRKIFYIRSNVVFFILVRFKVLDHSFQSKQIQIFHDVESDTHFTDFVQIDKNNLAMLLSSWKHGGRWRKNKKNLQFPSILIKELVIAWKHFLLKKPSASSRHDRPYCKIIHSWYRVIMDTKLDIFTW